MKSRTHPELGTPPPAAPPEKRSPPPVPFTVPDRQEVTGEPARVTVGLDPQYPDVSWVSHRQMGGGYVPEDFEWRSNPYEDREEGRFG